MVCLAADLGEECSSSRHKTRRHRGLPQPALQFLESSRREPSKQASVRVAKTGSRQEAGCWSQGRDEVARKWLARFSLSDLALATLGKEKGKPECSLNSLWGAGLTGADACSRECSANILSIQGYLSPQKACFFTDLKDSRRPSLKEAFPTH